MPVLTILGHLTCCLFILPIYSNSTHTLRHTFKTLKSKIRPNEPISSFFPVYYSFNISFFLQSMTICVCIIHCSLITFHFVTLFLSLSRNIYIAPYLPVYMFIFGLLKKLQTLWEQNHVSCFYPFSQTALLAHSRCSVTASELSWPEHSSAWLYMHRYVFNGLTFNLGIHFFKTHIEEINYYGTSLMKGKCLSNSCPKPLPNNICKMYMSSQLPWLRKRNPQEATLHRQINDFVSDEWNGIEIDDRPQGELSCQHRTGTAKTQIYLNKCHTSYKTLRNPEPPTLRTSYWYQSR